MRHLGKVHGLRISWLSEVVNQDYVDIRYIESDKMAADIFTKFYPDRKKDVWHRHRQLIGVLSASERLTVVGTSGGGHLNLAATPLGIDDEGVVDGFGDGRGGRQARAQDRRGSCGGAQGDGCLWGGRRRDHARCHEVFGFGWVLAWGTSCTCT